jgi:hypothetical protein
VNGVPCAVDCCVPGRPAARGGSGGVAVPRVGTVTGQTVTGGLRPG